VRDSSISLTGPRGFQAFLYEDAYDPVNGAGYADTLLDGDTGAIHTEVAAGVYTIYCWTADRSRAARVSGILTGPHATSRCTRALAAPGSVSGRVTLAVAGTAPDSAIVFLRGSPYAAAADSTGTFRIDSVAAGAYALDAYFRATPGDERMQLRTESQGGGGEQHADTVAVEANAIRHIGIITLK
jgi:hypothetical protein